MQRLKELEIWRFRLAIYRHPLTAWKHYTTMRQMIQIRNCFYLKIKWNKTEKTFTNITRFILIMLTNLTIILHTLYPKPQPLYSYTLSSIMWCSYKSVWNSRARGQNNHEQWEEQCMIYTEDWYSQLNWPLSERNYSKKKNSIISCSSWDSRKKGVWWLHPR